MKKWFAVSILICSVVVFIACGGDDNPADPDDTDYDAITDISFSEHVLTILDEYETILRENNIFPEGLQMDSWENLILGWERGEVIIPFDAEGSLLIELTEKLENDSELRADKLRLLKRWIDAGAANDAGDIPYADSRNLLYVCNQNAAKISVIDTEAKLVIRTVDLRELGLSLDLNAKPHHIAVEPDGSFWYVSLIGANKVLKFDRDNNFIAQADISIPALLAAHPTNGLLYVSRFPQGPGGDEPLVGVIRRSTMEVLEDIVVRPTPHAMAADAQGDWVYTCSLSENLVVAIDPATNEADESFVDLGDLKAPLQLAVSPDGTMLYVSAQLAAEVFVIDVSNPQNRTIVEVFGAPAGPWHPVVTPDGSRLYVGAQRAHQVATYELATGVQTIIGAGNGEDGLSNPHGSAVSNDGRYVFISNQNTTGLYEPRFDFGEANANIGTVVVIDTDTNTVEKIIEIEQFGSGMAISQF